MNKLNFINSINESVKLVDFFCQPLMDWQKIIHMIWKCKISAHGQQNLPTGLFTIM